jgi:hypothetical protein
LGKKSMEFDPAVQGRWKIALVCGAVSAGMLFSPLIIEHLGVATYALSFLGRLVAVPVGVLSLLAKEKKRLLAVPAITLALVCPYHLAVSFYEAYTQV